MRRTVKWHEDERVDVPDLSQVQGDVKQFLALLLAFVAGPSAAQTGLGDNPNAVWQAPIDLEFDGADVVIKIGTRLVLASNVDGATIVEWEAEEVLAGYTPTVGSPDRILMARIDATTSDVDLDDRVFRDAGTGSEQVINVATGEESDVAWTWCDNVEVDIHAQESLGFSKVARMQYNGGAPTFDWFFILPNLDDTGRRVQSLTEAVEALRGVIGQIQGPAQDWDRTPALTLDILATYATLHNAAILDHATRIGVLESDVASTKTVKISVPLLSAHTDAAWIRYLEMLWMAGGVNTGDLYVPIPFWTFPGYDATLVGVTAYGKDAGGFAGTIDLDIFASTRASGIVQLNTVTPQWTTAAPDGEKTVAPDPAVGYTYKNNIFARFHADVTAVGLWTLHEVWAEFEVTPAP